LKIFTQTSGLTCYKHFFYEKKHIYNKLLELRVIGNGPSE